MRSFAGTSAQLGVIFDVIGGDCTIPDLPDTRRDAVSFLTPGPEYPRLMVCGGGYREGTSYLKNVLSVRLCVRVSVPQEKV